MSNSRETAVRPARRTKGGEATRERILTAAERLFAAQGFSGVSMPEIAEASGITAGAIYKHFKSKAELFFHIVRRAVNEAPAGVGASLPDAAAAYTTKRLKQVRQMSVEVHYAAGKDPEVRRLLRAALDRQIGEIADAVATAQASGELAPDLDPNLAATAAMAFILGLMHLETLQPRLIGDAGWAEFVQDRAAMLLGATPAKRAGRQGAPLPGPERGGGF